MLVPRQWIPTGVWLMVVVWLVGVMQGVPGVADDDPPRQRLPKTRSPGVQSPDTRTPSTSHPVARPTVAKPTTTATGEAALPTIVTPRGGRRPVVLAGESPVNVPIVLARPANPHVQFDPATPWHFETLVLQNETVYQGLLLATTPAEAEFAHITRPPGKPMSAMVRVIPRGEVKRFDPLPPDQRDVLAARFHSFQRRATIEARKMETIPLLPLEGSGGKRLVYQGQWFQLESSADDESTRRCVVRIEQMFGGFRQLVPPRVEPRGQLRMVLFGSMDEFRDQMRRWQLDIENPAFYSPAQNMIVAGGDLSRFGDQLAQIRHDHAKLLRHFDELEEEFHQRLAIIRQEMASGGFQRDEIKVELTLRRARWREQHARLRRDIQAANRRNDTVFAEVTQRMLKRLYHEGFHAYLENFVFPHREFHVDRWLNEGLAQIFENGRFDVDVLRLDAPDPVLLANLQQDLASPGRLRLAQLLTAPEATFLVHHGDDNADRRYLYSWGVAYFLAFEQGLLDGDALTNYIAPWGGGSVAPVIGSGALPLAGASSDLARFEALVGGPLGDFETRWRDFMLELRPAS